MVQLFLLVTSNRQDKDDSLFDLGAINSCEVSVLKSEGQLKTISCSSNLCNVSLLRITDINLLHGLRIW